MPRKPDKSIIEKVYNDLRVERLTDEYNSYNRRLYECTCLLCGKKRLASKANLKRGEIKNCGYHREFNEIQNIRFAKLTALYPLQRKKEKSKNKCKLWRCICDCGNECDVYYNDLIKGKVKSCGCLKIEKIKSLYVEGTAPCKLDGKRIRSNNTSGTTGVWYDKSRGKWSASIVFKKKQYHLGRYDRKEDAIMARKIAESKIYGDFLDWYNDNRRIKYDS